jgi:protein-S-isoprenylcysteine O-methyltransferase Ste14
VAAGHPLRRRREGGRWRAPGLFGPRLFRSPPLEALGALLALASLGLQVTSIFQMGRSWRIGIDPGSSQTLVTSGVFAISRNPIYLALDGIAVATILMTGSLFFLITGLVVLASIHVQILREEAHLARAFGEQYELYRARVARYLGRQRRGKTTNPA